MLRLKKFLYSFRYAFRGIIRTVVSEQNMRFHITAAVVVIATGFYSHITATEWCMVILCIGLVICAEAFNTAIESLTDLIKPEHHPVAGKIKDAAAGAVLIAAIAATITGILIFWKYFHQLL